MKTLLCLLFCLPILAQNASWNTFGPANKLLASGKPCVDDSGNIYYISNGDTTSVLGRKWNLYKIDPQGQILWTQTYGSLGDYSASQIIFHNKKLFVAGEKSLNDTDRAWVSIIDTSGTLLQQTFYGDGDTTLIGQDITARGPNDIALLCQMRPVSGMPLGAQVLFLDSNLSIYSRHVHTDSLDFIAQEICALPLGGWVYTSDYEIANRFDMLLTKVANDGQISSKKVISNGYTRGGNAIGLNSKAQIVVGGESASAFSVFFDITLTIVDTNLNVISDVYVRPGVPKNDACFDMAVSPYDTYLFTGYQINPENGSTEMIVVESDDSGQRLFLDKFSQSATCIGSGIVCDSQGQFYAAGTDFSQSPSLILATGNAKGLSLERMNSLSTLKLYPNPCNGKLWLEGDFKAAEWELLDLQGRSLDYEYQSGKLSFDAKSGIYLLKKIGQDSAYRIYRN